MYIITLLLGLFTLVDSILMLKGIYLVEIPYLEMKTLNDIEYMILFKGVSMALVFFVVNAFCIELCLTKDKKSPVKIISVIINAISCVYNGYVGFYILIMDIVDTSLATRLTLAVIFIVLLVMMDYSVFQVKRHERLRDLRKLVYQKKSVEQKIVSEEDQKTAREAQVIESNEQVEELRKWKSLLDEGAITEEMYNSKRDEIFNWKGDKNA